MPLNTKKKTSETKSQFLINQNLHINQSNIPEPRSNSPRASFEIGFICIVPRFQTTNHQNEKKEKNQFLFETNKTQKGKREDDESESENEHNGYKLCV